MQDRSGPENRYNNGYKLIKNSYDQNLTEKYPEQKNQCYRNSRAKGEHTFYNSRMDWITQIEKRKLLIVGGILLIAFSALIVTSLRSPVALDPFWHLQMGKDWLENGLSPWVDHYSFTFNGHKITNPPVAFQVLLHIATSQFGMTTGFQVLRFGCFLLTIGASLLLLRQMKASAIIYALVIPMIVFLLQLRAMVRPELLGYTFSIIALMLYFRADNKISTRNMVSIVALMWVWNIYHSSVVGYVIFFGFFLDCAVAQFDSRAPAAVWVKWFAWGLLIVAIGFLNPSFSHPLVEAITFPAEWKTLINEYLPTKVSHTKSIAGVYVLILFAILTPVMAFKQRRFGMIVVWIVLVYSAVTMRRMVTPSGIVVIMLAAQLLVASNFPHRLSMAGGKLWGRTAWLVLLVSIGAALYSNVERAQYFMKENRGILGRYPIAIADYMKEQRMSGRILNNYGTGGYLIYRLSTQNQVYIDGRTQILYPLEHMQRNEEINNYKNPEELRTELDTYSIDQILWKHNQSRHDLVQEVGGFGLDFLSTRYVLYTREAPNFPLLGRLMARPECWRPDMQDELNAERHKMDEILPEHSALYPFADLVVGYSNADDGKAFFDANIDGDQWFDEMRRFAGFRFLETGHYDLTVNLLGGVEVQKPKDHLGSALAKLKMGDDEIAAQIIEEFSNLQWPRLQTEDIFIHYKLYQMLETQRELTPIEQERVEALKLQLVALEYPDFDSDQLLDVKSFCVLPEDGK